MKTNDATRATAEGMPKILVPYAGHSAIDQMDEVLAKFRVLRLAVRGAAQGIDTISDFDLEAALSDIIDHIDPIRTFLAENDFDDRKLSFFECRRQWFERVGGDQ